MSNVLRRILVGAGLLVVPTLGAAQSMDDSAHYGRRVSVGGEASITLSPRDTDAWFNYTDYDQNALRMARLRLFGEWHAADRISLVGELRAVTPTAVSVPALYLRWQPTAALPVHVQAGRVPPLIGAFSRRAYGRDNAVIGLPLAYQYLTSLRADALPRSIDDVLQMEGRGWLATYPVGAYQSGPGIPLVSVSEWDTGVQGIWRAGRVELSTAVTLGSPSVPVVRDNNNGRMWSGRATTHLPAGVSLGVSAARGQWIRNSVLVLTPRGTGSRSTQSIIGTDIEVGHGRWLMRGEWLTSRFTVPLTETAPGGAPLSAWSGFIEGRYRPHPRWQFGARVDRLAFVSVRGHDDAVARTPWDAPVSRIEAAIGFRATRAVEVRAGWQQNWRAGGRVRERGFPALSFLYWF